MATLAQIKSALARAGVSYHDDELRAADESRVTSVVLASSAGWDHDEMRDVARALLTERIDVGHGGCETCGFGATLHVSGIPHPFPCLAPGCEKLARGVGSFCSDACDKAWTVNEALVGGAD